MLEPPDLPDDAIVASARESYGIRVAALAFLPIGCDPSAWAYRLTADDGADFFLKVRKGIANPAGLIVPRYLHDHGVTNVVAPIPTLAQALWADLAGFALILYPFVDGDSGQVGGMSERNWVDYGAVLSQVHAAPLAPGLVPHMKRESFSPDWGGVLRQVDAHIAERDFDDPFARELAAFWRVRRPEMRALLERGEALGRRLRATDPPILLCHADIHTWNLMIDT